MIFAPRLAINTAPTEEHLLPRLRRINLCVRLTNVSLSRKYRMRLWAGNRNFCKWEFHRRFNFLLILEGGQVDRKGWALPARPNRGPCQGFSWPYLFLNSREDGKAFLQLGLVYWGDFPATPNTTLLLTLAINGPSSGPEAWVGSDGWAKGDTDPLVRRFVSLTTPQLVARGTDLISFSSLPTLSAPYVFPSFSRCKHTASNIKLPK